MIFQCLGQCRSCKLVEKAGKQVEKKQAARAQMAKREWGNDSSWYDFARSKSRCKWRSRAVYGRECAVAAVIVEAAKGEWIQNYFFEI
jgi:hypothetical protein